MVPTFSGSALLELLLSSLPLPALHLSQLSDVAPDVVAG